MSDFNPDEVFENDVLESFKEPEKIEVKEVKVEEVKESDQKAELRKQILESNNKLVELANGRDYSDIGVGEPYFDELKRFRQLESQLKELK